MDAISQAGPRPKGDGALADLATRQHGVVSRRQLFELGLGRGAIAHRVRQGRLHRLHAGVYLVGHRRLNQRGRWLAAVLAYGEGAVLSHASAAALWGLQRPRSVVHVTSPRGRRGRQGIVFHEGKLDPEDRDDRDGIARTSVARTLLDLAEEVDEDRLRSVWEEADRLKLLRIRAVERVCERGRGRRGLQPIRRLLTEARAPTKTRSPLEDRFADFRHQHRLPPALTNVLLLGHEVDCLWPGARLVVELDSWEFHGHRAAFRRDRARDSERLAAGYRTVRVTHDRLDDEEGTLLAELRGLLELPK